MLVQVLYFVALATIIPIVSLLSTSALYDTVGLCTVTFDFLQIVGLLTVVLGIVVYRLRPEEEMDPYTDDRGDTACIYDDQSVSDRIMNFAGVSSTKKLDPDHQAEPTPHDTPDLLNSSFQSWDSRESGHKDIKSVGQHEPTPTSRTSGWDQHAKDIDRGRERMAAKKSKSSKAAQLNSSFNHPLIDGLNPVSRTPSTG